MPCEDEWARERDEDEEKKKNAKVEAVMLKGEERFLRFSRVPNRSTTLRIEFIKEKYKLDQKEEAHSKEAKKVKHENCFEKIEKKAKSLEKKLLEKKQKKDEKRKKEEKRKSKARTKVCQKKKCEHIRSLGKPKKNVTIENVKEPFKSKLQELSTYMVEELMVYQPNCTPKFLAGRLEERLLVREMMENACGGADDQNIDYRKECKNVKCGDLKVAASKIKNPETAEPEDCVEMRKIIEKLEEKCTCCRDRSPEEGSPYGEDDVVDSMEIKSESIAGGKTPDDDDVYLLDSVAEEDAEDEEDKPTDAEDTGGYTVDEEDVMSEAEMFYEHADDDDFVEEIVNDGGNVNIGENGEEDGASNGKREDIEK